MTEEIAKIEPYLKYYCKERRETMQEHCCFEFEEFINPQDSLLYQSCYEKILGQRLSAAGNTGEQV